MLVQQHPESQQGKTEKPSRNNVSPQPHIESQTPYLRTDRKLIKQQADQNMHPLELSSQLNDSEASRPLIMHQGRCNSQTCFLFSLAIFFSLAAITMILLLLLGGCPDNPEATLQESFGFSCCDLHHSYKEKNNESISICHSKFSQQKSIFILIAAILSKVLSIFLLVFARKHYYSLTYAFCDYS